MQLTSEENQKLMKRYLQCPGMCRVEVLKKFVRNKYNVDTNEFHIDILYKRVPLPDHYTLIDIAYIYSWKRNEPMKFFFRITDINKLAERFDYFNSQNATELIVKTPVRTPRTIGDKGSNRKRESLKKRSKVNKQPSPTVSDICDKNRSENKVENDNEIASADKNAKGACDNKTEVTVSRVHKIVSEPSDKNARTVEDVKMNEINAKTSASEVKVVSEITNTIDVQAGIIDNVGNAENVINTGAKQTTKISDKIDETRSVVTQCEENKAVVKNGLEKDTNKIVAESVSNSNLRNASEHNVISLKPEVPNSSDVKAPIQKSDNKNAVYTNITLNRTNNIEIITKIQKVSNKDGQPIGLNIIKQTVKSNNKNVTCVKLDKSISNKAASEISRTSTSSSDELNVQSMNKHNGRIMNVTSQPKTSSINIVNKQKSDQNHDNASNKPNSVDEAEKIKFLESLQLTAISSVHKSSPGSPEKKVVLQVTNDQKRKNSSPLKYDQSKKIKLDRKPVKKIILHPKPKSVLPSPLENNGLKSLIENCKIPSSLSITIKDGTDNSRTSSMIPPVKNFIEILKLPDENGKSPSDNTSTSSKLSFGLGISDADSEQQVDEDLAEIAKSLTEKIPISTTISQIVGPKPQFPIPMQTNVPPKLIQPSPVPELQTKILSMPKENKLNPRSPQTFQRIFEESIKKTDEASTPSEKDEQKSALDLTNDTPATSTSTTVEISKQLSMKTKLEIEKTINEVKIAENSTPKLIPKVPIPRLPSRLSNQRTQKQPQKNLKFEIADAMKYQQTLANLHSNALGLNYTISVGPKVPTKANGIMASPKNELDIRTADLPMISPSSSDIKPSISQRPSPIPKNMSPGMGYNSPRNSPKHSPKSSPVIKHMYAPLPNQMLNQLQVNTYNQRIPSPNISNLNKLSPKVPQLPSPSGNSTGKQSHPSPKLTSPKLSPKLRSPATSSLTVHTSAAAVASKSSPVPSSSTNQNSPLSPNQILEKYNIQNLAQLTANLNFNGGGFGMNPNNQLAAIQHAMLLKHFEMQNRQNWLSMNQGPLLQYEKYLQSLKSGQSHLLSNIKEN
ncbi:unnamed protein product [Phaedon cochleariae]|uniref:RAWUL domain-containing protein n=1 Tax=Phaedon cochleariae TaxID=80249 RepID=A0A9N9X056_PHACE|nr:unnamed protein product [Phaedon cochleariae]